MTIKELSQLYWLNREIESDKKLLKNLEAAALVITVIQCVKAVKENLKRK